MKLWRVTCQSLSLGVTYVVAYDPAEAYRILRADLDRLDRGYRKDREMRSVDLVAEASDYPDCGVRLCLRAPVAREGEV